MIQVWLVFPGRWFVQKKDQDDLCWLFVQRSHHRAALHQPARTTNILSRCTQQFRCHNRIRTEARHPQDDRLSLRFSFFSRECEQKKIQKHSKYLQH
jgi:hypothetical protein